MDKVFIISKNVRGKKTLYVKFFDNEKKAYRQKTLSLLDTPANRKKAKNEILPAIQMAIDKKEKQKADPKPLSYYTAKYHELNVIDTHERQKKRLDDILAYFGEKTLPRNVKKIDVREFVDSIQSANKIKREYQSLLKRVLNLAVEADELDSNPADFTITLSRQVKREPVEPFSKDEIQVLLAGATGEMQNYLGIAFSTGARPEEIIALQIKDIDFTNQTIYISKAISRKELKPTKTNETRTIRLFDAALPYFEAQVKTAYHKKTLWLFSKDDGDRLDDIVQIRKQNNKKSSFFYLCKNLGVKYRQIMQTRHTFAVNAIMSKNFTLQEVAAILGHKDLRMIINHYARWINQDSVQKIDSSINIFGNAIGNASQNSQEKFNG